MNKNSQINIHANYSILGSCTLPRKQRNMFGSHIIDEGVSTPSNQHLSLYRAHGSSANLRNGTDSGHKAHKRASSMNNNSSDPSGTQNTFPPLNNDLLADLG